MASALHDLGADVVVTDPAALPNVRRARPGMAVEADVLLAVAGADVVLLLTEWPEYVALDPYALRGRVARRHIIDARNALDPVRWRAAGWTYRGIGRP